MVNEGGADDDDHDENVNANGNRAVVGQGKTEYKWWHEHDIDAVKRTIATRKEQATKQVEHDRYLKALRALIADKG